MVGWLHCQSQSIFMICNIWFCEIFWWNFFFWKKFLLKFIENFWKFSKNCLLKFNWKFCEKILWNIFIICSKFCEILQFCNFVKFCEHFCNLFFFFWKKWKQLWNLLSLSPESQSLSYSLCICRIVVQLFFFFTTFRNESCWVEKVENPFLSYKQF